MLLSNKNLIVFEKKRTRVPFGGGRFARSGLFGLRIAAAFFSKPALRTRMNNNVTCTSMNMAVTRPAIKYGI